MLDRLGREINVKDVILHCEDNKLHIGIVVNVQPKYIKYIFPLAHDTTGPFTEFFVKKPNKVVVIDPPMGNQFCYANGIAKHDKTYGEVITENLNNYFGT